MEQKESPLSSTVASDSESVPVDTSASSTNRLLLRMVPDEEAEDAHGDYMRNAASDVADSRVTISGASGKFLSEELQKWLPTRAKESYSTASPRKLLEWCELGVVECYDRPFSAIFNFIYDVLQFSSGRDKLCALMQGYAKFASAALSAPDSERHWMYRGIEDSISDGRKIFRLFKEFREVYKVRRGLNRLMEGISEGAGLRSIPAACGALDVLGHSASFFYYLFDNVLWAASVGLIRSKEVPRWQKKMWQGLRKNGQVLRFLGGVARVKRRKNLASIWRIIFACSANALLLKKALQTSRLQGGVFQGPDDPRLFHTLELVGMAASFRVLLSKLGYVKLSHSRSGLLAMIAAVCGIWVNWRKVRRKKCGTKWFVNDVERRRKAISVE
mmetsp:Transcript_14119/g.29552  ORF Transcript_14119/g.29552 Transcript_14119/m.29552 type:complete len:387 (+) Transcript_14119:68-1228(+)